MKIKGLLIILSLICLTQFSTGQKPEKKITISGIVKDSTGKPVKNVMIFIDKVKTSSTSNNKGFYKVKASPGSKVIVILSPSKGVASSEINGRTNIDFIVTGKFENMATMPEEEKVTIGYGEVSKRDATTSVPKLDARNDKFIAYKDIYEMINGRFPGVEVVGKSIRIAGASSFMLSTEPLFVVDGMIIESVDGIAPSTVKTIEVLKGPAASIYGARGANGVIVITTLTGKD